MYDFDQLSQYVYICASHIFIYSYKNELIQRLCGEDSICNDVVFATLKMNDIWNAKYLIVMMHCCIQNTKVYVIQVP